MNTINFKTRIEPVTLKELGQIYSLLRMQKSNLDESNLEYNPIWVVVSIKLGNDNFFEITRLSFTDERLWPKFNEMFAVSDEGGNYPLISFRKRPKRYKSLNTLRADLLSVIDTKCLKIHEYFG